MQRMIFLESSIEVDAPGSVPVQVVPTLPGTTRTQHHIQGTKCAMADGAAGARFRLPGWCGWVQGGGCHDGDAASPRAAAQSATIPATRGGGSARVLPTL